MNGLADLTEYPLDAPGGPEFENLVGTVQEGLADKGASVLEHFVSQEVLDQIVGEIGPALHKAFYKEKTHNVCLDSDAPDLPGDHPRNVKQRTTSATLAYDYLPPGNTLECLYRAPEFISFLARTLDYPSLHPYEDPLAPINILVYDEGKETGWHFDSAEFTLTLLLQEPEGGAVFDYAPFIRGADDTDFSAVEAVLEGRSQSVITLNQSAGDLVIFRGHRTLHRVTQVTGSRQRLIAVFSYAPEAGMKLNPHTQRTFFGRAA